MKAPRLSTMLVLGTSAVVSVGLALPTGAAAAGTGTTQTYTTSVVGGFGGEPSIATAPDGTLYYTSPSDGMLTYVSHDAGATWNAAGNADTSSGDNCVATDQAGSVYECNLAGSVENAPLQADVWKSTDQGVTWARGGAVQGQQNTCGTSCNPFGVDRDWVAATIPAGKTSTNNAEVVLAYHDFYGPSSIWVNISTDGGKTFGATTNVLAPPAVTPGAVAGTIAAEGYTFCSTVPAGVGIVPAGHPHAGRIIVGWIAADAAQDGGGCNVSQYQAFHTAWVSYSDDGGTTWTPQLAYDAGVGHDMSTPFVGFTIDNAGNPYFAYATNANSVAPVCAAEFSAGTLQSDQTCAYNMYVIWSADQGATWDGGGGTIPGSAAAAYQVNAPSETGTHWFPAIAAYNPGQVDVAYLRTDKILSTGASGKANPGACGANSNANPLGVGPCNWNLYAAQSTNLTQPPGSATWSVTNVTNGKYMHVGDICNLGIACVAPGSDRNLLDFIQTTIDPTTGCAHVSYADDHTTNKLMSANQTGGCLSTAAVGADLPETAWPVVLIPLAAFAVLAVTRRARSRRLGAVA